METSPGVWCTATGALSVPTRPLAASAGIRVMQEGGNAFDAALAVAATEAVTLVPMCGMGGDSFILAYEAATGQLTGINSSGAAPTGATADYYRSRGYDEMPLEGPHAISVPGEVAAWEEMHRRFCTMPFPTLLETAIGYAEEGFPVSPGIGRSFAGAVSKLSQFPASSAIYSSNGGIKKEGEILANPDLARSLQQVAPGRRQRVLPGRPGAPHGEGTAQGRRPVHRVGLCRPPARRL